jgi:subtilisin family serine protease
MSGRIICALFLAMAFGLPALADAAVSAIYTPMSGLHWRIDLLVDRGDEASDAPAAMGIVVQFDPTSVAELTSLASADGWDSIVLQPDPGLPAGGVFDSIALEPIHVIRPGDRLSGFALEAMVQSSPSVSPAPWFQLYDANGTVIASGVVMTSVVPEPGPVGTSLGGLAILLALRWWRRKPILLAMAACFGAPAHAATSAVPAEVADFVLLSETRLTRTLYEYRYALGVRNQGQDLNQVKAQLAAAGQGTTIIDDSVDVGDLDEGETAWPTDTITLRHDRSLPFDKAALVWRMTGSVAPKKEAMLLRGAATDEALQWVEDFRATRSAEDIGLAVDAASDTVYHSRHLLASVKAGATVAAVNTALSATGGRIGFSSQFNPVVTIQFMQDKSADELRLISAKLESSGAFEAVGLSLQILPDELPPSIGLPGSITATNAVVSPGGAVRHHAAIRLPSAWNARKAVSDAVVAAKLPDVEVIVADYFGRGRDAAEMPNVDGITEGASCIEVYGQGKTTDPCDHGYHVLGILTGSFGGGVTPVGQVTGAMPLPLKIHVIDLAARLKLSKHEMIKRGLERIVKGAPASRRFILSMSLPAATNAAAAKRWQDTVRNLLRPSRLAPPAFDYESRLIQVSSAGNRGKEMARAQDNSPWNAAVLMQAPGLAPLTNGLVVEDRDTVQTMPDKRIRVSALSPTSTRGGTIGAVGTKVHSFLRPQKKADGSWESKTGIKSGTSMSTPQVAGTAAYLLALSPTTSTDKIISLLRAGGQAATQTGDATVLDAYAAVLRLDTNLSQAPIRQAILNVGTRRPLNQGFGFDDALLILDKLTASTSGKLLDFSSHDLNGDGFTGGEGKAPVDLDLSGTEGRSVPVPSRSNALSKNQTLSMDERLASDIDVLCFYVNSPLFETAAPAASRQRLLQRFRARVLDKSKSLHRELDCGAFDWEEPYAVESVLTRWRDISPVHWKKGGGRCPDGKGGTVPCDVGMHCNDEVVGEKDTFNAGIKFQSHLQKIRITGAGDPAEGTFVAYSQTEVGKIKIESVYPKRPTIRAAGVQYYTAGKGTLDATLDPKTGRISGKVVEDIITSWDIGTESVSCTSESAITAAPLTAW